MARTKNPLSILLLVSLFTVMTFVIRGQNQSDRAAVYGLVLNYVRHEAAADRSARDNEVIYLLDRVRSLDDDTDVDVPDGTSHGLVIRRETLTKVLRLRVVGSVEFYASVERADKLYYERKKREEANRKPDDPYDINMCPDFRADFRKKYPKADAVWSASEIDFRGGGREAVVKVWRDYQCSGRHYIFTLQNEGLHWKISHRDISSWIV